MTDSTLYTIGTALRHAQDAAVEVEVLVDGHWVGGVIRAVDGHGLVLAAGVDEHAVVRMDDISAVRVLREAPAGLAPAIEAGARPMPPPGSRS